MRGHRIGRIGLSLAVGAVGVAALAGSSAAATKPAAQQAKLKNIPIVIGASSSGTVFLPEYVALANGYFAKAGLSVSLDSFSGGDPTTMAAFVNNDINVIAGGASDDLEYVDNGVILPKAGKFFAELVGNAYDIVANKSITSLKQIEGKTVGISGPNDGDELYFEAVMKHYKIPLSSVTFITAGSTSARLSALAAGTVDAIAESNSDRTTSEQVGNVILTAAKSPIAYPNTTEFASTTLLKHTAELKSFVGALTKATAWIRTHEIAATAICQTATGGSQTTCQSGIVSTLERSFGGPYTWSSTDAVDLAGISSTIKVVTNLFPQYHVKLTTANLVDSAIAGTKA